MSRCDDTNLCVGEERVQCTVSRNNEGEVWIGIKGGTLSCWKYARGILYEYRRVSVGFEIIGLAEVRHSVTKISFFFLLKYTIHS